MKPSSRRSTNPKKAAVEPPKAAARSTFIAEALTAEKLAGFQRHAKIVNGQPVHQIARRFYE
jgi:hypothetical protein